MADGSPGFDGADCCRRAAAAVRGGAVIGLRSQFGDELLVVLVVSALAVGAGLVVARREHKRGGPWLRMLARILAIGAVIATIAATALPRRLGIETDGDLVLQLGGGGLRDWRVLLRDPLSLASIQLVANVSLYAGVAFTAFFGWMERRRFVIPACLALSVAVELAQWLVLGRVAALDDVLLNGAGALVGYGLAFGLLRTGMLDGRSLAADAMVADEAR